VSVDEAERLVHQSGQIAAFFRTWPEERAVPAIAGHINQFWAPHMRRAFLRHFAADHGALDPRVGLALPLIQLPEDRQ
jgi:formate dehydrogenase subunit delta